MQMEQKIVGQKNVLRIVADSFSELKMRSLQIEGECRGLSGMIKTGASKKCQVVISRQ